MLNDQVSALCLVYADYHTSIHKNDNVGFYRETCNLLFSNELN